MIGNGVCDPHFDGNALVPFAHGMGLISDMMHKVIDFNDCTVVYNLEQIRPMVCVIAGG